MRETMIRETTDPKIPEAITIVRARALTVERTNTTKHRVLSVVLDFLENGGLVRNYSAKTIYGEQYVPLLSDGLKLLGVKRESGDDALSIAQRIVKNNSQSLDIKSSLINFPRSTMASNFE